MTDDAAGVIERSGVRVDGWHEFRTDFVFAFRNGIFGGNDGRTIAFLATSLPIDSVDDDDDRDGDRVRIEFGAEP